jgi:flagellum-specific ATP synthase
MPAVASEQHLRAAQRLRAIYATYRGAEDLINIGAFAAGSNRRIDTAISLIDRLNEFLVQPTGEPTALERTVSWLDEMTADWDLLSSLGRNSEVEVAR